MNLQETWTHRIALLGTFASLGFAACSAPATTEEVPGAAGSSRVHMMPVSTQRRAQAIPSNAHLSYYGGPVIPNVNVWTVYWGSGVLYQNELNAFYTAVTDSPHFDWLSEYNTGSQSIGRGSLGGSYVDSSPPGTKTVDDKQIRAELAKLINNGSLPANDANTLYMFHFAPGYTITQGGQKSCSYFCAYHGTTTVNGGYAYYGVIPDQGGACANGCGKSTQFNNTTSSASHELIEAVTDAAVGAASGYAAPLAWYDKANGEIGDICVGYEATVAGYDVQKEWSNANNGCIAVGTSCSPSCAGKQCGGDGCGGSCGTCPTGQTCDSSGKCQTSCAPDCTGKQCGDDGCGGSCGTCGSGLSCDSSGQCTSSCVPSCAGKQCGDDGCGGSCGTCGSGQTCDSSGTCQGGSSGCSHPICSSGGPLKSGCDPCATKVCAADSYCCSTAWDNQCVGEVASICGQSCGGGGGGACAHPICTAGAKLKSSCDPCAAQICAADSFCCTSSWDNQCVSEVGSICGQSC